MEQLERATRKYGTFVWIPMAYYKWAHMLCKLQRGLQVLSTEIILLYRKDVETRPIERANPQQSRPGQFLRVPTTWLVLQGAPGPQNPASTASVLGSIVCCCELVCFPPHCWMGAQAFLSLSHGSYSLTGSWSVCVFLGSDIQRSKEKKKKAMEIQENTMSEWASKQVNIILLFKFLKYF